MICFHTKYNSKYLVVKSRETMNRTVFLSIAECHPPHCLLSPTCEILVVGTIFLLLDFFFVCMVFFVGGKGLQAICSFNLDAVSTKRCLLISYMDILQYLCLCFSSDSDSWVEIWARKRPWKFVLSQVPNSHGPIQGFWIISIFTSSGNSNTGN